MATEDERGIKLFGKLIPLHGHDAGDDRTVEKRPEKIIPCPRCKSTETKFCYFNNYNVNQPRHYCKCCQRYWTAGGALRNVPVGAGRRKGKLTGGSADGCFREGGGVVVHPAFVVEEWSAAMEGLDGSRHGFAGKRRRDFSYGQPY